MGFDKPGPRELQQRQMREARYNAEQKRLRELRERKVDTSDIPEADEAWFKKAKLIKKRKKKK